MTLKEVTVVNKTQAYSAEFFKEVSRKPVGKLFAFEQDLPETTIRSQAATFGKSLGVKFTVVAVPVAEGQKKAFAVGVTTKTRKPREKKPAVPSDSNGAVPSNLEVVPLDPKVEVTDTPELDGPSTSDVPEQWLPSGSDQQDAVEAIVDAEGV